MLKALECLRAPSDLDLTKRSQMGVEEIAERPSRAVNPEQLNRKAMMLQLLGNDEIMNRRG
jgi:hypothetical protein